MSTVNGVLSSEVKGKIIDMFIIGKTYNEMSNYCRIQGFQRTPEQIRKMLSNLGIIKKYRHERSLNNSNGCYEPKAVVNGEYFEPDGGFSQREYDGVKVEICIKEDKVDKSVTSIYHEGRVIDVLKHWIDKEGNLRNEYKPIAMHLALQFSK